MYFLKAIEISKHEPRYVNSQMCAWLVKKAQDKCISCGTDRTVSDIYSLSVIAVRKKNTMKAECSAR